jgi:cysteinyl-tRNA synthetase
LRTISLDDTRTGQVRELDPLEAGKVRIYACGPTVYGPAHVGNARPFVVFMLLRRFLVHEGYEVTLVSNITDVNDKIYAAAQTQGVRSDQLAAEMTAAYIADTNRLDLGRPDHEPLASETIPEIVALIERLVESGHAYPVQGDVYFNVRSYPEYGEISHQSIEQMDQGEGVEGAELKRDPLDFALWKRQKPEEDTAWNSPWGRGRPGWHIECSAMAELLLGVGFEIHGGGSDLIFPHHENEAAQTAAARGAPLAQLWVHNGMVQLRDTKMAKSVGNVFVLGDALNAYGRDAVLMYFCEGHYHQPMEFDEARLSDAAGRVRGIREGGRRLVPGASPEWSEPLRGRFFDALAANFNTPQALAAVSDWVREANRSNPGSVGSADLVEMLGVLGLENLLEEQRTPVPADVSDLSERRERARSTRDYAESDRLREELRARGWEVRDGPSGPELVPLNQRA